MNKAIIGAGGGGKGGGNSARVPVEAKDSLRSKAFANVLDAVGEGEIGGLVDGLKSVYLDGTPIQNSDGSYNFTGVELQSRNGTQAQGYVPGFTSVESTTIVAIEATTVSSVTRQVTNANINAMRVTVGIPQLTKQDTKTGDMNGTSVDIAIDLQSNGGGFAQVLADTITGKSTTRYQRSYRVELTGAGPWDVRVRRLTADSSSVALSNQTWWDSYTEIIDAKLRYPNTAVVGIKVDSSQFKSVPTRGYDVKMLKVRLPSNYNPTTRAYSGSWDGTFQVAWSDNPAWCFYDLVTNKRYGLGALVDEAQVDKWALYQIGRYCDELVPDGFGSTEPRFTCNIYFQTRAESYKVLQDFASIFRGMAYWATGAVTAVQDAPSDPVALFTAANVIGGQFAYSGSSLKARHTVALVTWNDPADLYRQKVEYVEDEVGIARYGVQQANVLAIGCTSRGQANRVGRWLLYSERTETEMVSFSVGLDGAVVRPGNVILVSDSNRAAARLGGRVASATVNAITVDKAPTLTIAGWTIYAMLVNGEVETRTITALNGNVVSVAPAFTSPPTTQGVWVISSPTVEAQYFRVVQVTEDQDTGNYEITALRHEPLKYDAIEQGLVLQARDYTLLNNIPSAPTGLQVTEALYTYQASVFAKINLGWTAVEGAFRYVVEWLREDGNWTSAETQAPEFELLDATPGSYSFKVYARNPAGLISQPTLGSLVALGKTAPPADITGFTNVVDPSIGVTLAWARVVDLDLDTYEIRQGVSWAAGTLVAQTYATTLKIGLMPVGSTTYWAKALDTSGNYSAAAVSTTVTITAAAAPTVTASFVGENVVLSWGDIYGSLSTQAYEVRYGASFAAGVSLGTIKATRFTAKAQWSGARSFWVAAIDLSGNMGAAGLATASVAVPTSVVVTQEVIDNNVLLKWGDATATLPVDFYELRRGATWAGATVIGRVSARFSAIFESTAGTFTYWVTGYDVAGNQGANSSVNALVSQPPDYTLQYNLDSAFGGTRANIATDTDGSLLAPMSVTETWQDHFTTRGWTTLQSQVSAGFPIYAQPSQGTGSYEETIDYGTVLSATKITATLSYMVISGAPVVTPQISVRKLITDAWTDYAGLSSVFVTDFRYVKVRYDFGSTGGDDLVDITGLNVRFDVKLKNDAGTMAVFPSQAATYTQAATTITVTLTAHGRAAGSLVDMDFTTGTATDGQYVITAVTANTFTVTSAVSATTSGNVTLDGAGTPVLFNVPFVDVQSITLSPSGTTASIAVYNFVDVPNPTGFKILQFNTSGTRIAGIVGWNVKGV
jgi:predicted phage tail protein